MTGYQIEGRASAVEPWLRFAMVFTTLADAQAALRDLRANAHEGWPEYRIVEVSSGAAPPGSDA